MDFSDDDSDASGPTMSEVLLFLTLPASAAPLSSSLMPRHHRERILEYTKTVTVTEVVNNSTHCHPGTCEVTVTNIDSGSGHPVSVNISHLHEQTVDEGSGRCSPVVHVRETIKENTPTDSVEKIDSCVERILRVQTEGDVTFKHRADNVVDLSFTTPVKPVQFSELTNPDTTLYYHSFKKEITKETANDLISPDSAVSESSKRYMRSDDSDSDSGSLIIHSPVARPDSGVSSGNNRAPNGKNLSSISIGSSEDDLHYQGPSSNYKDLKNDRLPYYIVTSKAETYTSHPSSNTTTFSTDLDTSGTTTTVGMNDSKETTSEMPHPHRYHKRGSRDREKRRSILVVTNVSATPSEDRDSTEDRTSYNGDSDWHDSLQKDKRKRITMEVLFTPPTPKENGAPPKPPRRAKYDRPQLVEHVQHYECSLDEMNEGPKMTSTPISTLERQARKSTDETGNKVTEDKQNETPIMSPRKSSKPPALPSLQPVVPQRQSLASPRRSPSSPIIVVDQERKSSMDLLVPPKQPRRKSTITDIDWFAAFNMKEPTTPKSPRSPMVVDALKEVENAVIEKRRPRSLRQERPTKPLSPAKIDLDDVFTYPEHSIERAKDDKCSCNACVLMKMSPEEVKRRFEAQKRRAMEKEQPVQHHQEEITQQHHFIDSDISLDDVFAPRPKTKKVENHQEYYAEAPTKERDTSVHSTNMHDSIFVFPSSADTFDSHTEGKSPARDNSKSDISMDDIFHSRSPVKPQNETTIDTDIDHHKSTIEASYSISRPPKELVELNVTTKDQPIGEHSLRKTSLSLREAERDIPRSVSAPETVISEDVGMQEKELKKTASEKDTTAVERDSSIHEISYVPSEVSLDDVFSQSPAKTAKVEESKEGSPPPQRPERRKNRQQVHYKESDISLDDIFSTPSTSSLEPAQDVSTESDSVRAETRRKSEQLKKNEMKKPSTGAEKEDEFFTPATSFSQLKSVPSASDDSPKTADMDYTASDISLDDVFASKTAPSEKVNAMETVARTKEGREDQLDIRENQSDVSQNNTVNPLNPQKIEEQTPAVMKAEHPAPALKEVNWLEELLTQNHQPKEEDLKQTVMQLYEKVIPSPSNSSNDISSPLNDTMESGYTSLDRTKGSASHDVSMNDGHPDLDKVFNPISVDRKHDGETNVASVQSESAITKDQLQESEERKNSEKITETRSENPMRVEKPAEKENESAHVIDSEEYHDYRDKKPDVSSESVRHEYLSVSRRQSEDAILDEAESIEGHREGRKDVGGETSSAEINLDDVFSQPSSSRSKNEEEKEEPAEPDTSEISREGISAVAGPHSFDDEKPSSEQPQNKDKDARNTKKDGEGVSAVEINLDDVFNQPSSSHTKHEEEKISKTQIDKHQASEKEKPDASDKKSPGGCRVTVPHSYDDEKPIDMPPPSKDEIYYREEIKNNAEVGEETPAVEINLDDVLSPPKSRDASRSESSSSADYQDEPYIVPSEEHTSYTGPKHYVHSESRRLSHSKHQSPSHQNLDNDSSSNIDNERTGHQEDRSGKTKHHASWIESIVNSAAQEELAEDNGDPKDINLTDVFEKKQRQEMSVIEVQVEAESAMARLPELPPQQLVDERRSEAEKKEPSDDQMEKDEKAAQKKDEVEHDEKETKPDAAEQLSWITQIIDSSKEKAKKRKEKGDKQAEEGSEEPLNVDDLLKDVFDSSSGSHEKGEHCNCSACRLTKMSREELEEYLKEIKAKEVETVPTEKVREEDYPENSRRNRGPVNLDDVFEAIGVERVESNQDDRDNIPEEEDHREHKHSSEKATEKPAAEQRHGITTEASTSMDQTSAVDLGEVFSMGKKEESEEAKKEKKELQWLSTIVDKTEKTEEQKERQYSNEAPTAINLDSVFSTKENSKPVEQPATTDKETVKQKSEAEKEDRTSRVSEDRTHLPQERSHSEPSTVHTKDEKLGYINIDDIFTGSSSDVTKQQTEVEISENLKKDEKDSSKMATSGDHHISEQGGSGQEKHDDHWIQAVMSNSGQDEDEPDTFEASYLKSIKEESKKEKTAYDDYYREETEPPKKKSGERRHLDDYYDEPEEDEEGVEELDVADWVNDILSTSLNEAAFKVATKDGNRDTYRTDTSVDRNRPNHTGSEMYVSTTASDNRMESILSYPPSVASPVTPHSTDPGAKFISEASMTLSNSQDDDYIIRLVFANQKGEELPQLLTTQQMPENNVVTESEVASRSNSIADLPMDHEMEETRNREHHWTNQRSMSRTDEEVLEVEVNQESFVIKGNYTIVINKQDPLGVLLSELTAGSKGLDFSITPKIRRLLLQCIKEKAKPNIGKSLSSRAKDMLYSKDHAYLVHFEMSSNQYSADNTTGNINFCTAENNVCNEMVEERFRNCPDLFTPDFKYMVHYGPPGGYPEIKSRICEYLRKGISSKVNEENVVLLPSGNSTYDMVCHCLFESDDVLLTNTPTYGRNIINVSTRAQCELASVDLDLSDVRIDLKEYDRVYKERCDNGDNVRAVVVINPNNPLGVVFSLKDLEKLAHWAEERNLWLIIDELFSQCIYDQNTTFESFVNLQMTLPVKSVCFWSLSKDFGLPGVKLSIVHTNDRDLHHALSQLELTGPVSTLAQDFVANFLSDNEWLAKFKEDKLRRLRAHYKFVTENLKNLGITYIPATAGIFLLVDFRKKMRAQTAEGEDELYRELASRGIYMTPGSHTMCPQLGWMRLVFSCSKEELREGFRRLYELYGSGRSIVGEINY